MQVDFDTDRKECLSKFTNRVWSNMRHPLSKEDWIDTVHGNMHKTVHRVYRLHLVTVLRRAKMNALSNVQTRLQKSDRNNSFRNRLQTSYYRYWHPQILWVLGLRLGCFTLSKIDQRIRIVLNWRSWLVEESEAVIGSAIDDGSRNDCVGGIVQRTKNCPQGLWGVKCS